MRKNIYAQKNQQQAQNSEDMRNCHPISVTTGNVAKVVEKKI